MAGWQAAHSRNGCVELRLVEAMLLLQESQDGMTSNMGMIRLVKRNSKQCMDRMRESRRSSLGTHSPGMHTERERSSLESREPAGLSSSAASGTRTGSVLQHMPPNRRGWLACCFANSGSIASQVCTTMPPWPQVVASLEQPVYTGLYMPRTRTFRVAALPGACPKRSPAPGPHRPACRDVHQLNGPRLSTAPSCQLSSARSAGAQRGSEAGRVCSRSERFQCGSTC